MPFACNRLFRERVGAVLVYQLQSRRRFLPGTVRPKKRRRLPSKHPKIHHRPIVDESEHVSMQGQVRTNRRGQCPFPGHDLSVPQVISIIRAMLARCDTHFALLARRSATNRASVRFAGVPTMYFLASSRLTSPSALRPRCIWKIYHTCLGGLVPRAPARSSVPMFW